MTKEELLKTAKPILFNTEMVRATLDGRKVQTRRTAFSKKKLGMNEAVIDGKILYEYASEAIPDGDGYDIGYNQDDITNKYSQYKKGDILYVRETWKVGAWRRGKELIDNQDGAKMKFTNYIAVDHKCMPNDIRLHEIKDDEKFEKLVSQSIADVTKAGISPDDNDWLSWDKFKAPTRWRPSIHMPKKYARIFLKVTDVRVERVNDISMYDAYREGYDEKIINNPWIWFSRLWNSTSKDGYKWKDNPYVFVYEIERVQHETK